MDAPICSRRSDSHTAVDLDSMRARFDRESTHGFALALARPRFTRDHSPVYCARNRLRAGTPRHRYRCHGRRPRALQWSCSFRGSCRRSAGAVSRSGRRHPRDSRTGLVATARGRPGHARSGDWSHPVGALFATLRSLRRSSQRGLCVPPAVPGRYPPQRAVADAPARRISAIRITRAGAPSRNSPSAARPKRGCRAELFRGSHDRASPARIAGRLPRRAGV